MLMDQVELGHTRLFRGLACLGSGGMARARPSSFVDEYICAAGQADQAVARTCIAGVDDDVPRRFVHKLQRHAGYDMARGTSCDQQVGQIEYHALAVEVHRAVQWGYKVRPLVRPEQLQQCLGRAQPYM
jgi:hypothetical protein